MKEKIKSLLKEFNLFPTEAKIWVVNYLYENGPKKVSTEKMFQEFSQFSTEASFPGILGELYFAGMIIREDSTGTCQLQYFLREKLK